MNKVSDKERREVAQRLRSLNPSDTCKLCDDDFFDLLSETLGVDTDQLCYDARLIKRLADLIDRPAVKPIHPYDDMPDYIFCGECNTQIWNSANYCPQCGTRCVQYSKPFFDDEDRRIYEAICSDV